MILDLRIPDERLALPKDIDLRPKQAKAWVESLPLSQSAQSGRKILSHVYAVNRAKVGFDDRLRLLETYRPVARVVLDELDAICGDSLLPLQPRAREALDLAREIAREFAYGYKILVLEKTGKLLAFGAKKQLPLLVVRAMESLVQTLRTSYRAYTPVPEGAWREIHLLYLHADREGFADAPADPENKTAIAELYGETLLIALTDPYRLGPGDFEKINRLLREKRGAFTLGQTKPRTRPDAHFLVPCDQDRPPKPLLSAHDEKGGPNWRLLDANPIVERLRALRQAVTSGNVSATTSKIMSPDMVVLLGKLVTLWGDPPKRLARRDPMDSRVAICAGMRAITHFISLDPLADADKEAEAIERAITIPLITIPDDETSAGMNVSSWDVVNQSSGGLKVRRVGKLAQSVTVGEVLGIKFIGRAPWTIGVVRWITTVGDDGIEFGIQFLARAARLVAVQPKSSAAGQVRPGLLLSEEERFVASDMILTPPSTFSELREFEIECDGIITRVRSTSLIERTGRFELFQITPS